MRDICSSKQTPCRLFCNIQLSLFAAQIDIAIVTQILQFYFIFTKSILSSKSYFIIYCYLSTRIIVILRKGRTHVLLGLLALSAWHITQLHI